MTLRPPARRVMLHRCDDQTDAERWADACRAALRALGIAAWWRVRIDPDGSGAPVVGVDYEPGGRPW